MKPVRRNSGIRLPIAGAIAALALLSNIPGLTGEVVGSPGMAIASVMAERQAEAERLSEWGKERYQNGEFREAIALFEAAVEIYRELGDHPGEARCLNNLGLVYQRLAQYQTAIAYYRQSLAVAREVGIREIEAILLYNLGIVYDHLEQYRRAAEFYRQSLAIVRQIDDRDGGVTHNRGWEARLIDSLGFVGWRLGEYRQATEHFRLALSRFRELGDRAGEAHTLVNLGVAYRSLGQYREAVESNRLALSRFRELGNRAGEARSLTNLGNVYRSLGQYREAIAHHNEALDINREIGNRNWEAESLMNLGNVYDSLGWQREAIDFYERSLAMFRELGNRSGEAGALNNLGIIHRAAERYGQAIDCHRQSLAIKRELGDREGEGRTLNNLGRDYHQSGRYGEAGDYYRQALAVRRELGDREGEGRVFGNLGILFADRNQPELAIAFLKRSVNVRERIRADIRGLPADLQQSYLDTIAGTYRRLADLLLRENRVLEAQRVLDLLKVQELDDYLNDVRGNADTAGGLEFLRAERDILDRYDELQRNAVELGAELARLQRKETLTPEEERRLGELDEWQTDMKRNFNDFAGSPDVRELIERLGSDAREQSLPLGALDRLRDKLGESDAVLLYPLILDDRLELIVTVPDSPPLRRTVDVPRQDLNEAIVEFRQALQSPTRPLSQVRVPAQKLYRWLVEPLEEDLKSADAKVIIYAPDGPLRYIPLAALHDGQQWLVERFRVNNITAASIEELDTRPQPEPRVLAGAFADRTLIRPARIGDRDVEFAGLPFAGIEVDGLKRTLPDTVAYLDEAFTLDAVRPRMNGYTVLHFATHAALVPGDPSESFIVFGGGENPTLRDVASWSLHNVDLVVLSACETGLGGFDNGGEQILGLGYQFQHEGARAVIASLWGVDDGGTQLLMNAFYAALQQGYAKTEALRRAQLALLTGDYTAAGVDRGGLLPSLADDPKPEVAAQLAHPYYWAPFILIGNGL